MPGTRDKPKDWVPDEPVEFKWNEEDHGKYTTYNKGCRCELCRAANTERMAKYRSSTAGSAYKEESLARQRAMVKLAQMHPEDFNDLLRAEIIEGGKATAEDTAN
jgi:hypothetical protein